MRKKWLWLTIGVVMVGFLIMAAVARPPEPISEAAAALEQAPAPPLTFRERKERGLLKPEEQRIADEIAKMQEANKEYEKQRQIRLAREAKEREARFERQREEDARVAKRTRIQQDRKTELQAERRAVELLVGKEESDYLYERMEQVARGRH